MNKHKPLLILGKKSAAFFLLMGLVLCLSNCEKKAVAPAPLVSPVTVSYNNDIQPLFDLYCALSGCHTGANPSARLDLSAGNSYYALLKRNEINISDPLNSRLYTALNLPMPPWGKLVPYDTGIILEWIQQGANDN